MARRPILVGFVTGASFLLASCWQSSTPLIPSGSLADPGFNTAVAYKSGTDNIAIQRMSFGTYLLVTNPGSSAAKRQQVRFTHVNGYFLAEQHDIDTPNDRYNYVAVGVRTDGTIDAYDIDCDETGPTRGYVVSAGLCRPATLNDLIWATRINNKLIGSYVPQRPPPSSGSGESWAPVIVGGVILCAMFGCFDGSSSGSGDRPANRGCSTRLLGYRQDGTPYYSNPC